MRRLEAGRRVLGHEGHAQGVVVVNGHAVLEIAGDAAAADLKDVGEDDRLAEAPVIALLDPALDNAPVMMPSNASKPILVCLVTVGKLLSASP